MQPGEAVADGALAAVVLRHLEAAGEGQAGPVHALPEGEEEADVAEVGDQAEHGRRGEEAHGADEPSPGGVGLLGRPWVDEAKKKKNHHGLPHSAERGSQPMGLHSTVGPSEWVARGVTCGKMWVVCRGTALRNIVSFPSTGTQY